MTGPRFLAACAALLAALIGWGLIDIATHRHPTGRTT